jgi:hypothetical protein
MDAGDVAWIASVIALSVGATFLMLLALRSWMKKS